MVSKNPELMKRNRETVINYISHEMGSLKQTSDKSGKKGKESSSHGKIQDEETPKKKKTKYRNTKMYLYEDHYAGSSRDKTSHGKVTAVFDSIKEFNRWNELLLMERGGEISGLTRQKVLCIQERFKYGEETIRAINYKADFAYIQNGIQVIEDVKGYDEEKKQYMTTKDFKLKWKLLKYKYREYDFRLF